MGRFLSDAADPAIYQAVRRQLLAMDAQGYAGCACAIRDMALADRLHAIACPTLVVTGTRDTSTPFEGHGEHLVARIPGARHVALAAAHLAPLRRQSRWPRPSPPFWKADTTCPMLSSATPSVPRSASSTDRSPPSAPTTWRLCRSRR
jgi:pimeloyl-ACP methyl ester carboxylesterase